MQWRRKSISRILTEELGTVAITLVVAVILVVFYNFAITAF